MLCIADSVLSTVGLYPKGQHVDYGCAAQCLWGTVGESTLKTIRGAQGKDITW